MRLTSSGASPSAALQSLTDFVFGKPKQLDRRSDRVAAYAVSSRRSSDRYGEKAVGIAGQASVCENPVYPWHWSERHVGKARHHLHEGR